MAVATPLLSGALAVARDVIAATAIAPLGVALALVLAPLGLGRLRIRNSLNRRNLSARPESSRVARIIANLRRLDLHLVPEQRALERRCCAPEGYGEETPEDALEEGGDDLGVSLASVWQLGDSCVAAAPLSVRSPSQPPLSAPFPLDPSFSSSPSQSLLLVSWQLIPCA